jgi:hypothetical protein
MEYAGGTYIDSTVSHERAQWMHVVVEYDRTGHHA